jgi:hypothetical protein
MMCATVAPCRARACGATKWCGRANGDSATKRVRIAKKWISIRILIKKGLKNKKNSLVLAGFSLIVPAQ